MTEMNELEAISKMNIYQKINAVSSEIGKVKMTLEITTNKSSYKAISINDVVDSIIPLAEKYRIAIVPGEKEILESKQVVATTKYGDKAQFFVRIKACFIAVNIDNPAEAVLTCGYGDGIDSGDKATGKANTYARKYALIDLFNISKGDDPDAEPSLEYNAQKASDEEVYEILSLYKKEEIQKMLKNIGVDTPEKLTHEQAQTMINFKKAKLSVNDTTDTY